MPAKLQFIHGAMGSGKTAEVIMLKYNYEERGRNVLLMKPQTDQRDGEAVIRSRIGLESECMIIEEDFSADSLNLFHATDGKKKYDFIIVDEVQFLSPKQVKELVRIVDEFGVEVMCYGLRTDFQGKLFPASECLLAQADIIKQMDPVCWCGRKAIMNARLTEDGKISKEGEQVLLGGDERYTSLCRKHWQEENLGTFKRE